MLRCDCGRWFGDGLNKVLEEVRATTLQVTDVEKPQLQTTFRRQTSVPLRTSGDTVVTAKREIWVVWTICGEWIQRQEAKCLHY